MSFQINKELISSACHQVINSTINVVGAAGAGLPDASVTLTSDSGPEGDLLGLQSVPCVTSFIVGKEYCQ